MNAGISRAGPCVSVNIVTYNRRNLLQRCIASVLAQTFRDFEIVVVDDGSTDDTRDLFGSIRSCPVRYRYVPHTGKLSFLRNCAAEISTGKYVAFLDSDDEWDPAKLEKQVARMERDRLALTFTDATTTGAENTRGRRFLPKGPRYYTSRTIPKLFTSWFIYVSSTVIARSAMASVGPFDESRIATGDAEFILRAIRSEPFGLIHEPLLIRHMHERQHSSGQWRESYTEMLHLAQHYHEEGFLTAREYRRSVSGMLYRMGGELHRAEEPHEARKAFGRSFAANPLNVRAGIRWALH